jgi:hypothetical protein
MMLSLVLAASLAQAPEVRTPVGVALTSKRPGAEAVAGKIAARVFDVLTREGVAGLLTTDATAKELTASGFSDPRSCQGTRACLTKLAILLGPRAVVVGVDVGKVGKTLAIHLEAVAADQEKPLARLDVSSSFDGWGDAMSVPIVVFARDVKAGVQIARDVPAPPPPAVALADDAPRARELTPAPVVPAVTEALPAARTSSGRVLPWVLTGAAVVAAGSAATFGVLASIDKARYDAALVQIPRPDGTFAQGSTLPENEAKALATGNQTKLGLALGSAVLSAALGATAAYLFTAD